MKVPRPQEYVVAAFLVIAAIGPALLGLLWHLVLEGAKAAWRVVV